MTQKLDELTGLPIADYGIIHTVTIKVSGLVPQTSHMIDRLSAENRVKDIIQLLESNGYEYTFTSKGGKDYFYKNLHGEVVVAKVWRKGINLISFLSEIKLR